ncbi:hypothetical protein ASG84_26230 [Rhodococcus sp. Leaf278]|nr:hypothetical protein ASG84_26230 [Rhodococcus sp. Leaf278]
MQLVCGQADPAVVEEPVGSNGFAHPDRFGAIEESTDERRRIGDDVMQRSLCENGASLAAGARSDRDEPVRLTQEVHFVIDQHDGIAVDPPRPAPTKSTVARHGGHLFERKIGSTN